MSLAMTDRPMTVDEVALFCGVSAKTVRRAIEEATWTPLGLAITAP
jgi:hypothetical protein